MSRWMGSHRTKSILIGAVAAATIGGLTYFVAGPLDAFGSGGTTTLPAAASQTRAATASAPSFVAKSAAIDRRGAGRIIGRLLRRSVHATFLVKDGTKGYVTVTLDRGTVQSVSSSSITVMRPDGVSVTESVTTSTKFVRTPQASLAAGQKVILVEEGGSARDVVALARHGARASAATPAV